MDFKSKGLPVQTTIKAHGRLFSLDKPIVMGILNATPDSFYNQGKKSGVDALLQEAAHMLNAGAQMLDIGGVSTRPGAVPVAVQEEIDRVIPVIQAVCRAFPSSWISVDTTNARVAREAVESGASIVNDVSAGRFDPEMFPTVAALGVPYIAMHMQGTPATMQQRPAYKDVVVEVIDTLGRVVAAASDAGICDIILDPGFGFGKTVQHNYTILRHLHALRTLGKPILAGLSRKSMICRPLGITPANALNGTTALNILALQQGASILRVHDVKEAIEVVRLFQEWEDAE